MKNKGYAKFFLGGGGGGQIDRFQSRGQQLCKLLGIKESFYTVVLFLVFRKKINCYCKLTNRPQFSMVHTLIDQRNDVIKCSKLKWNHWP